MILTGSEEIWMALPRDAGETRQWVRARGVEEGAATVLKGHSANVFVDDVRRGGILVVFGGVATTTNVRATSRYLQQEQRVQRRIVWSGVV